MYVCRDLYQYIASRCRTGQRLRGSGAEKKLQGWKTPLVHGDGGVVYVLVSSFQFLSVSVLLQLRQ